MTVSSGISSSEDQAGTADRTPPESWDESLYQATMQVLDAPEQGGSVLGKLGLLVGTLALFVLVFLWLGLPLLFLLILLLVIVFHELGHYIGMWIFGYRDLRMFFIPFFGAAVSGVKYGVPVWQQATVLLLGPLPGLALALAVQWNYEPAPHSELAYAVLVLGYLNAFNLLPFTPLDGGRLLNVLFFARRPYLAAGFQFLAGCALAALAWFTWSWVFALIALVVLLGVSYAYDEAKHGVLLRAENLQLPNEIERLDDAQRRLLFARAVRRAPDKEGNPANVAAHFRAAYEHMVARSPGIPTTILFTALYLSGFAAFALVTYIEGPLTAADAADRRALYASLRGKRDEALAEAKKALAIREAYAAKYPARGEAQYELSRSHEQLGRRVRETERLAHLQKSLAIRVALVRREPSVAKWQYALARGHKELAGYYSGNEALEHMEKALTLTERAIAKDWRAWLGSWWSFAEDHKSELAELHSAVGGLLMRTGQPGEAAKHFKASLSLEEKLAAAETTRQPLLALGHQDLGEALVATGSRAEAVEHFRQAVRIHNQLIAGGKSRASERNQLDGIFDSLTRVLLDLQRPAEALDVYRAALANYEEFAAGEEQNETKEKGSKPGTHTARALGDLSRRALLARDFAKALAAADRSLSLVAAKHQVEANRADALLFLGRADEAKAIYLARKGQPVPGANKQWEQVISEDFAFLRRAGLTHPMMPEIQKLLGWEP